MNDVTPTVAAVGQMHFEGNIIPHTWYKNIHFDNGKPDLNAIIILAEIVYWYRPTIILNKITGAIETIRKKFDADLLQRSYDALAEKFGLTKRQCQDAVARLETLGLVRRVFRTIFVDGMPVSNVLFIDLDPITLQRVTYHVEAGQGVRSNGTGVTPDRVTYTENTTQTTTETTISPQAADAGEGGSAKGQAVPEPTAGPVSGQPLVLEAVPATNGAQMTLYDLPLPASTPLLKVHQALLGVTSKEEWYGQNGRGGKSVNVSQIDTSRIKVNENGLTQALLNALEPILAKIYGWEALIEASEKAGVRSEEREVLYEHIPQLYAMGIDSVEKLKAAGDAWDADKGTRFGRPQGRQFLKYVSELNARLNAGESEKGGKDAGGSKTSRNGSKSTTSPLEEWEREHGPVSSSNLVADKIWKQWPQAERHRYFAIAFPDAFGVRDVSNGHEVGTGDSAGSDSAPQ